MLRVRLTKRNRTLSIIEGGRTSASLGTPPGESHIRHNRPRTRVWPAQGVAVVSLRLGVEPSHDVTSVTGTLTLDRSLELLGGEK